MEIIKRKISLEDYTSRAPSTWGEFIWNIESQKEDFILGIDSNGNKETPSLMLNVFIKQNMDDMGIGTNLDFIENLTATTVMNEYTPDVRYENKTLIDYFSPTIFITGTTSSRTNLVKSYSFTQKYQNSLNMLKETNISSPNYAGNPYTSTNEVISNDNEMPITYIINGDESEISNIDLSNPSQEVGILFKTFSGITNDSEGELTEMYYKGQGFNESNTTLSAITKDEYLFGITSSPTVFDDVNIDRGINSAFQSHLQLGEIRNMRQLIKYGNGYYKIQKL
tara:strand:- start:8606 stop:9448 length:843 start_codon:yes stop_codon:yes gene_type:complete